MPDKPIDRSFFKEDWNIDETPTVPYGLSDQPSDEARREEIRTEEALAAYDIIKKESAKFPVAKMRMSEVQRTAADYIISRANLNIAAKKGIRGEPVPYTELVEEWRDRGRCHEALINALKSLADIFNEYKLDKGWKDVIGLHDREKIAAWTFRVGSTIAADLAQQARQTPKTGKGGSSSPRSRT